MIHCPMATAMRDNEDTPLRKIHRKHNYPRFTKFHTGSGDGKDGIPRVGQNRSPYRSHMFVLRICVICARFHGTDLQNLNDLYILQQ